MQRFYKAVVNNKYLRPLAITSYILIKRAVPIVMFALLLSFATIMVDKYNVEQKPGSDYLDYYTFDVQNARAGEDVYFKVCRRFSEPLVVDGTLSVYVYDNDNENKRPVKVYSRDIDGLVQGDDCENKVVRARDFEHTVGTYKMAFCVGFEVKYNVHKTACKDSNIYKIYEQPDDIGQRIKFYEQRIKDLNELLKQSKANQQGESGGVDFNVEGSQQTPPTYSQPSTQQAMPQNQPSTEKQPRPAAPEPQATAKPQQTQQPPKQQCVATLPILGTKLLCATNND